MILRAATLTLCMAVVACSPQREVPAAAFHACAARLDVDMTGWQTIEERDFTFRLPPGFIDDHVQGIDSHVRQWSDERGRMITLDYGAYSPTLEDFRENESGSDCVATIGGRQARVAAARGYPEDERSADGWIAGVAWRDLRDDGGRPSHLTMFAVSPDTAGAAELLAAMRTTVFHFDD